MTTIARSYHVEPNEDPLTRGTRPWRVVCSFDGWSLECRTFEMARAREDWLNILDTAPVSISTEAVRANAL